MRALLFILFCNLASAEIPADLIGPRDLIPQIFSGFNNYLYKLEMNSIVTESDRCKVFEGKVHFTMCISRTQTDTTISETVHYYVNNELKSTMAFTQTGTNLLPTINQSLYNFEFPIQDGTTYSKLIILDIVQLEFYKNENYEYASMKEGGFNTSILDTTTSDGQIIRQYDMVCSDCYNINLTVRDHADTPLYQSFDGVEVTPLEFKNRYNMFYAKVYSQFASGLPRYGMRMLGFPE